VFSLFVTCAIAQIPPATPPAPILNPSSPLVLRQAPPIPVSPAPGFSPGSKSRGTNQVVNPSRGVFNSRQCSGSDYLNRISALIGGGSAGVKLPNGRAAGWSKPDRVSCRQGSHAGVAHCRNADSGQSKRVHR